MFKKRPYLILLLQWVAMTPSYGEHAVTDSDPSKTRYQTDGSSVISATDCDKHHFSKYSGLTQFKVGEKKYKGDQPPLPLFSQIIDERTEKRGWASPHGGGSYDAKIFEGYHNGLAPIISENFSILLSHALDCQSKGNSGFLEALKEDLQTRTTSAFFHQRYKSDVGIFTDNSKVLTDRTEENFPEIARYKKLIELFLSQMDLLEYLRQEAPELFEGLKEQIAKNTNPKDGYLSSKLQKAVTELKRKLERTGISEGELGKAQRLAGIIKEEPTFASLLPSDQSAYYRQLLSLGPSITVAPLSESSSTEKFSEHERRLAALLQDSFKGQSAAAGFLADSKKRSSTEAQDRSSYWDSFDSKFSEDLAKLKTPAERNQVRDRIMKGLGELSHGSNWTRSYPPTTSHAQEALIRASRLIEEQTIDPIAGRKSADGQFLRGDYSQQIGHLRTSLHRSKDGKTQKIDQVFKQAELQLDITIPEEVKNKIRQMDPFLLELLKDNVKGGNAGVVNAFKKFFLTGHSTALFNLKDENIARLLFGRLENLSRNSPLLKGLSWDEQQFLSHGLWAVAKPDSIKDEEWKKNYTKVRSQLVKALEPALSKITNPPSGYRNLPDDEKALLYTLEMLDSLGNHNVNPYAFWEKLDTANFYEIEQVADRVTSEIDYSRQLKVAPDEIEQRLSSLFPGSPIHGIPSHARIAQLHRTSDGPEGYEQQNLKLLSDIITHQGRHTPSDSEIDHIKSLAFENTIPEDLAIALEARVPGFFELDSTLRQGLSGPVDTSPEREDWKKQNEDRARLITTELRKAKTDLIDKLHHTTDETQRNQLIAALIVLRELDDKGPKAFQEWYDSADKKIMAEKDLILTVSPYNFDNFLNELQQLSPKENEETTNKYKLAQQVEESLRVLARLKASLGETHPSVKEMESVLKKRFGEGHFKTLYDKTIKETKDKTKLLTDGKETLLKKYKEALKWNEHYQAFEIDKNRSFITEEMLKDLETHYPGFKVVFRDNNTGISSPQSDGKKALDDWIQDRSIDFLNNGLYIGENQWFPLNEKTAIKLVRQNGSLKHELSDRLTLEKKLELQKLTTNEAQMAYHKAKEAYGKWDHGFEGWGRSMVTSHTSILLGPAVYGAYLMGLTEHLKPENSTRTRNFDKTYGSYRKAVEDLRQFGQLGPNSGESAEAERLKQNEWSKMALQQEKQVIKSYEDNAMLAKDVTLFLLSLPFGGVGASAGKAAITTAERAVLQKALERTTDTAVRQGLSRLLAKEVITVAEANASRHIIGTAAKEFSKATLTRMGLNQFSNQLVQSTKYAAGFAGVPSAIGLGYEEYQAANKRGEIESKFKKGEEWRKYPKEPQREEGKSEEQFLKEWNEWATEIQFDRNRDGKPDFLQAELKDVAVSGPDRARYLEGILSSQRQFFVMGGTGQLLPNSRMVAHIAASQLAEKEFGVLTQRGEWKDLLDVQKQKVAGWEAGKGTLEMVPGMFLQYLGMRNLPAGLQRNFQLGRFNTNTRELVGITGLITGNQGTTAVMRGELPKLDVNLLTSLGMEFYIGRSMAQHTNLKLAQEALSKLPASSSATLEGPGTKPKTSSRKNPQTIEDVAKNYGHEAVEYALFQMSPKKLADPKSGHLLDQASQYLKSRGAELAKGVESNPHAKKTTEQVDQDLQKLRKELGGASYFRLSPQERASKSQELAQLEAVMKVRQFEGVQQSWAETSDFVRQQQRLNAQLNYINTPQSQQQLKARFSELGAPEVADALIATGKKSIPARIGQAVENVWDKVDRVTGLPSTIYEMSGPSFDIAHQRANDLLIKTYRDNASKPEVQDTLKDFIGRYRTEAFGVLRSSEIKSNTDKSATKMYAFVEMVKLGVVTRESPKGAVERTLNDFVDFATAHRDVSPNKTLKELWEMYSIGGTEPTPSSSSSLPSNRRNLPGPR